MVIDRKAVRKRNNVVSMFLLIVTGRGHLPQHVGCGSAWSLAECAASTLARTMYAQNARSQLRQSRRGH